MKRIITIFLLLLSLALVFTSCGKSSKKETVYDILTDAVNKTFDSQKGESAAVWEQALNGGSIAAEFTYNEDIIPIKTISGKYYLNSSKQSAASILSLGLISGESFDLSVYSTAEKAVFVCSALADAYGFTNQGLSEFISQTISGDTAASSFAAFGEALAKVIENQGDKFIDTLEKHFPLVLTNAESSLTFTVTVSNTNVKAFLGDVIDMLKNDADFKNALQDVLVANGESVTLSELNEGFDEMKEELSELDEVPFNANLSITATTKRIITGASITVYEGADATGTPIAKVLLSLPTSGGFTLDATIEGQTITVSCTVTEYGTITKEVLSIGAMGVNLTPLTLTYDSANGDYELKVEIPGTFSAVATGKYTSTKTEATLTLSSIKVTLLSDYNDFEDMGNSSYNTVIDLPMTMTLTVKAKDTAPKAPTDYTDITKLTEDTLEELAETLMDDPAIATFIEMIGSLVGNTEEVRPID